MAPKAKSKKRQKTEVVEMEDPSDVITGISSAHSWVKVGLNNEFFRVLCSHTRKILTVI